MVYNDKKEKPLMREAKNTIKLGVTSQAGLGAMGAMSGIPGMPSQASHVTQAAGAGLGILNVGQMAKSGMVVADVIDSKKQKRKSQGKVVDKILG